MTARGKRYAQDDIVKVLKEIEAGGTIASVARAHGISSQTVSRWRLRASRSLGTDFDELRALQSENQRLKRIVARQALEIDAYREVTDETW